MDSSRETHRATPFKGAFHSFNSRQKKEKGKPDNCVGEFIFDPLSKIPPIPLYRQTKGLQSILMTIFGDKNSNKKKEFPCYLILDCHTQVQKVVLKSEFNPEDYCEQTSESKKTSSQNKQKNQEKVAHKTFATVEFFLHSDYQTSSVIGQVCIDGDQLPISREHFHEKWEKVREFFVERTKSGFDNLRCNNDPLKISVFYLSKYQSATQKPVILKATILQSV